jgi:hypothetical protein
MLDFHTDWWSYVWERQFLLQLLTSSFLRAFFVAMAFEAWIRARENKICIS